MGRPLKRWPTYALEELEKTLFLLSGIEKLARGVQEAIAEDDARRALILLSDVRVRSQECVENLVRAKTGNYEREIGPTWSDSEPAIQPAIAGQDARRGRYGKS